MAKLALIALMLGACVAEDPSTAAKVITDEVTPTNVVDEVEIPTWGDDNVDRDLVIITGVRIPGHVPTTDHIDLSNIATADPSELSRTVCALADQLPGTNVCSYLCQEGFAARVLGSGTSNCTEHQCNLPGGVSVTADVCTAGN